MLFNSYVFIFIFLPITLIGYFLLGKFRLIKAAKVWLLITSLFFYGYWNPPYLIVMVISIVFNHQMGNAIANALPGDNISSVTQRNSKQNSKAKLLLWVGIVINLVSICYYKYMNFFLASVNGVLSSDFTLQKIILPLGISFYTFTQIAYLVDVYRGETQENKYDLVTYSLFVVFFPQLIAGPILRHDELIPELSKFRKYFFSHKNFAYGVTLFSLGLAKKVLIADNISPWVATAFNNIDDLTFIEAWVGALSYTFQLYFDFSGYSDMAIGLGWMFNINLPINFDSPYKATSISDFWRRWHITLSNFLRDYLYIPLGGSRQGELRRYTNLITTMLLGGLWHGAGWTYVIWGGLHGIFLAINHWWRKLKTPFPGWFAWTITFLAVIFTWVLFRATSLQDGLKMLATMTGFYGITLPGEPRGKLAILSSIGIQLERWPHLKYLPTLGGSKLLAIGSLIGLACYVKLLPNTQEIMQQMKFTWWWAIIVGFMASICLLSLNRVSEFLYFQF
jgi:alginate O-acetyltransferase complex protein AlgI